jgi:hypothetical protein
MLRYEDARYEMKMVCRAEDYGRVKAFLDLDPAGLHTLYPLRRVQSVYLDTPGGEALEDNLAGISHREKVRFRWYGEGAGTVQGRIECKVRENMLGWKHALAIEHPVCVEGADRYDFVEKLRDAADPPWRARLAGPLEPVQWISYSREYLGSADGRLRITVDRDLKAFDQRGHLNLTAQFETPVPAIVVIEVKCAAAQYDAARQLINRLPFFVDKCSKFVTASMPDAGPGISFLEARRR